MKKLSKKLILLLIGVAFICSFAACNGGKEDIKTDDEEALQKIIEQYVNNTVIRTYRLLSDNAIKLHQACEALQANKTDANVQAACKEWISAREYWEKTEAFLFGPAGDYNLDPQIDSWPLDKNQLDQILASDIIQGIDAEYVRNVLGFNLKGFHAVEYVIFRDGGARAVSDISDVELLYLVAVSETLAQDCILLEASWAGMDGVTSEKREILEELELIPSRNYGNDMMMAGQAGSPYKTVQQACIEIIEGCIDIADEVGNSKIADPVNTGDVLQVESWYSWNSLDDFTNNIVGIENSYMGGMEGYRDASLSEYVEKKNATLNAQIQAKIRDAITAINAIPAPFRNNLHNTEAAQAAMDACDELVKILSQVEDEVLQ
ncbi:MAG: peptidase M75 [Bacteroidales bacterium]|nr:peptidase M75 [Bacteroidales bacterium]